MSVIPPSIVVFMSLTLDNMLPALYPSSYFRERMTSSRSLANIPPLVQLHMQWVAQKQIINNLIPDMTEKTQSMLRLLFLDGNPTKDSRLLESLKLCFACGICLEIPFNNVLCLQECGHFFCRVCISSCEGYNTKLFKCPTCRAPIILPMESKGNFDQFLNRVSALFSIIDFLEVEKTISENMHAHGALASYKCIRSDLDAGSPYYNERLDELREVMPKIADGCEALQMTIISLENIAHEINLFMKKILYLEKLFLELWMSYVGNYPAFNALVLSLILGCSLVAI
ncbi:hypothetical protein CPB84DRAFT_1753920 [Gymnopilus junonius]|uniref:RING-type domain-containing protein n=1 Tax=Gymnopilus junonius TaxID=109634 RepID=A0A9P5N969_GYMJU|nr:hypothetical protein CPB84DRAFT_1753920 [Gymnopilus junonius]